MKRTTAILFLFYSIVSFDSLAQSGHLNQVEVSIKSNKNNIYPSTDLIINTHTDFTRIHYPKRILEFKKKPLQIGDVVFLGNSLKEQGNDWTKKLNNSKVRNRGIAGDTTDGVLARLEELICFKPSQVFILIGINDLFRENMSPQKVYNNIVSIVRQINNETPETEIFVQTILPTTNEWVNSKIETTNLLLKDSVKIEPYKLIFLHNEFATENNAIKMSLSTDGVHLNKKGYNVWVNKINNLIKP